MALENVELMQECFHEHSVKREIEIKQRNRRIQIEKNGNGNRYSGGKTSPN